jgi:ubiquinone/menaquinone biosynthesis C-methylase UbiE
MLYGDAMKDDSTKANVDREVVEGFGYEWSKFDQASLSRQDQREMFNAYFSIFPWHKLSKSSVGFDLGCGSGRWAELVAPRVGKLHCIDPSMAALSVAKQNLNEQPNCEFHLAAVDGIPLKGESADFGYALGVLHHIPDTEAGVKSCVSKLKRGAPLLLYLYYGFDNRPWWFKLIWRVSDLGRLLISRTSYPVKYTLSQIIAATVYLPLSNSSLLLEKLGFNVVSLPLSQYRNRGFYVLRTDALDRFGTKLEKRFTKDEIRQMMKRAGLVEIVFRSQAPYWCALGYKSKRLDDTTNP